MSQEPLPVFIAHGLTKTCRTGEVEAHTLRGVDPEIYESEFVVLLGPSGSGKSTLLNILGGLAPAVAVLVAQARAALSQARQGAMPGVRWDIRAPVAGRVLKVLHECEGDVPLGEPLLELGDPADLEVVVDVLTIDAL